MKIRFDSKSHKIARRKLIRQKESTRIEWMKPEKDSAISTNSASKKG